jgi:Fe2+ or Zn2+ uptake regulation protein
MLYHNIHDAKLSLALKHTAEFHGFFLGNELTEIRGKCNNCQQH